MTRCEPFIDEELMPYFEEEPQKDFAFARFERSSKNIVNVLSGFLSKSESVFSEAMDSMEDVIGARPAVPAPRRVSGFQDSVDFPRIR
jgi:hypothetical protein